MKEITQFTRTAPTMHPNPLWIMSSHSNNPRIVISWLVSIVADISTPNTSASCHFIFRFMISGSNAPAGKSKIQFSVLSEKVDAYFAWAKQKYSQVTHNSTIGKALAYSINQEEYLRVFLSDGHVPMDNNYAEQAIRPFTIGRKNFVMINLLMVQRQVPSCTVWSKQQMQT